MEWITHEPTTIKSLHLVSESDLGVAPANADVAENITREVSSTPLFRNTVTSLPVAGYHCSIFPDANAQIWGSGAECLGSSKLGGPRV